MRRRARRPIEAPRLGGAESKRRRRPRLPAPPGLRAPRRAPAALPVRVVRHRPRASPDTRLAQTSAEIVGIDVEGLADALEGDERVVIPRLHPCARLVEQEPRGPVAGPAILAIAVE